MAAGGRDGGWVPRDGGGAVGGQRSAAGADSRCGGAAAVRMRAPFSPVGDAQAPQQLPIKDVRERAVAQVVTKPSQLHLWGATECSRASAGVRAAAQTGCMLWRAMRAPWRRGAPISPSTHQAQVSALHFQLPPRHAQQVCAKLVSQVGHAQAAGCRVGYEWSSWHVSLF